MEAEGMQFDSLNYFTTAVANLPTNFGLEELHKGYIPHLFSTPEHHEYKADVPAMTYYDPDGMKPDRKKEFEARGRKQTTFDFEADLEKNCVTNVDIHRAFPQHVYGTHMH